MAAPMSEVRAVLAARLHRWKHSGDPLALVCRVPDDASESEVAERLAAMADERVQAFRVGSVSDCIRLADELWTESEP